MWRRTRISEYCKVRAPKAARFWPLTISSADSHWRFGLNTSSRVATWQVGRSTYSTVQAAELSDSRSRPLTAKTLSSCEEILRLSTLPIQHLAPSSVLLARIRLSHAEFLKPASCFNFSTPARLEPASRRI